MTLAQTSPTAASAPATDHSNPRLDLLVDSSDSTQDGNTPPFVIEPAKRALFCRCRTIR